MFFMRCKNPSRLRFQTLHLIWVPCRLHCWTVRFGSHVVLWSSTPMPSAELLLSRLFTKPCKFLKLLYSKFAPS